VHTVAVARAEKADALATAAASAAAKTEALSRLAAADGARKAVQRRLALLQEVAPKLALMTFTEVSHSWLHFLDLNACGCTCLIAMLPKPFQFHVAGGARNHYLTVRLRNWMCLDSIPV
jgi:hypothetical protein